MAAPTLQFPPFLSVAIGERQSVDQTQKEYLDKLRDELRKKPIEQITSEDEGLLLYDRAGIVCVSAGNYQKISAKHGREVCAFRFAESVGVRARRGCKRRGRIA